MTDHTHTGKVRGGGTFGGRRWTFLPDDWPVDTEVTVTWTEPDPEPAGRTGCIVTESPVRVCCGQRHFGAECPDGFVMCCICFTRVTRARLATDEDGNLTDVCLDCEDDL